MFTDTGAQLGEGGKLNLRTPGPNSALLILNSQNLFEQNRRFLYDTDFIFYYPTLHYYSNAASMYVLFRTENKSRHSLRVCSYLLSVLENDCSRYRYLQGTHVYIIRI